MAGTRTTKNLIKEILQDDEVLKVMKEAVMQALDSKFQELFTRLEEQAGQILDLQHKVDSSERDLATLKANAEKDRHLIAKLQSDLNNQEQYSRRNCLRIFGVPEADKENTDDVVCRIANQNLGVELRRDDIDRSHRVQRRSPPPVGSSKPSAIIVKMTSYRLRQRLLTNRKKLKGTGLSICEDLTDPNRSLLHDAFLASRTQNSKVVSAWSQDGRIIVAVRTSDGKTMRRQVHSKADLTRL
ncbi:uncharacterized protein [Diadema antillarum]|uniref:uncharacterized protein n=1 Tax=Diadema antillarum TaxID=105358 RepID=UPI003A860DC5